MSESTENMHEIAPVGSETKEILLFGGKIKLNNHQLRLCKILIPLAVIFICAIVLWVMLSSALESGNNIDGRFANSVNGGDQYIQMNSDGEYVLVSEGKKKEGKWSADGSLMTFKSGDSILNGRFIDRKYIVFIDDNFLSGDVSSVGNGKAEVTAPDGTIYGFDPDGKYYCVVDGANTEIGSYIADGRFIIVTAAEGNVTYLNCGDGITSVFYQAE